MCFGKQEVLYTPGHGKGYGKLKLQSKFSQLWILMCEAFLTQDNLLKRGFKLLNRCFLCKTFAATLCGSQRYMEHGLKHLWNSRG